MVVVVVLVSVLGMLVPATYRTVIARSDVETARSSVRAIETVQVLTFESRSSFLSVPAALRRREPSLTIVNGTTAVLAKSTVGVLVGEVNGLAVSYLVSFADGWCWGSIVYDPDLKDVERVSWATPGGACVASDVAARSGQGAW